MAEPQSVENQISVDTTQFPCSAAAPISRDEITACILAMEAALLPCLPARELQAIDRPLHSSHQIDVEKHARDFMEAAKKLQLYFISLQRMDQPSRMEMLQKEISNMKEELKMKMGLLNKHHILIQSWLQQMKQQVDKHKSELESV